MCKPKSKPPTPAVMATSHAYLPDLVSSMLSKSSTSSAGGLEEDEEISSTWRAVSLSPYSERTPMSIDGKLCAGDI